MLDESSWTYALIACGAVLAGGCAQSAVSQLRTSTPAEAAARVMELYDTNKDGKVAADEVRASPALVNGLSRIDKNRDGAVVVDEMQARFDAHDQMPDLIPFEVYISAKRQPLEGATVTLTAEPFMGEGKQSYVGSTNAGGVAYVVGQDVDLPGLPTGYYTVHIVHAPSETDVKVGCEVAHDLPERNRFSFDTQLAVAPTSRGR